MRTTGLIFAALIVLAGCSRAPAVPKDRPLWRIEGEWVQPKGTDVRTALATIVVFRSSGEYVEHHCRLIEQPDTSVYIASTGGRTVAVGSWKQEGAEVTVTRQKVLRKPPAPGRDPICDQPRIKFHVESNATAVTGGDGTYVPVTRLVSPDFESYVNDAKKSPVTCTNPGD